MINFNFVLLRNYYFINYNCSIIKCLQAARQQLERLPRRQGSSAAAASLANNNIVGSAVPTQAAGSSSNLLNIQVVDSNSNQNQSTRNSSSQFLIKYVYFKWKIPKFFLNTSPYF